ncbi:hypothetical protein PV325_004648 [Microctonus aethiopoides]|nr:hypothetical protein PV325_004648 [Microctonus aethiopoides]
MLKKSGSHQYGQSPSTESPPLVKTTTPQFAPSDQQHLLTSKPILWEWLLLDMKRDDAGVQRLDDIVGSLSKRTSCEWYALRVHCRVIESIQIL